MQYCQHRLWQCRSQDNNLHSLIGLVGKLKLLHWDFIKSLSLVCIFSSGTHWTWRLRRWRLRTDITWLAGSPTLVLRLCSGACLIQTNSNILSDIIHFLDTQNYNLVENTSSQMFWESHLYIKKYSLWGGKKKTSLPSNHSNHLDRNMCSGHGTFWRHRPISILVRTEFIRHLSSLGSTMEAVCLGGCQHNEVPWQCRGCAPATWGHVMGRCSSSRARAAHFPSYSRGNTHRVDKGCTACFNSPAGVDNKWLFFSPFSFGTQFQGSGQTQAWAGRS